MKFEVEVSDDYIADALIKMALANGYIVKNELRDNRFLRIDSEKKILDYTSYITTGVFKVAVAQWTDIKKILEKKAPEVMYINEYKRTNKDSLICNAYKTYEGGVKFGKHCSDYIRTKKFIEVME